MLLKVLWRLCLIWYYYSWVICFSSVISVILRDSTIILLTICGVISNIFKFNIENSDIQLKSFFDMWICLSLQLNFNSVVITC